MTEEVGLVEQLAVTGGVLVALSSGAIMIGISSNLSGVNWSTKLDESTLKLEPLSLPTTKKQKN